MKPSKWSDEMVEYSKIDNNIKIDIKADNSSD